MHEVVNQTSDYPKEYLGIFLFLKGKFLFLQGNVGISVRDEAGRDVPMDTKDMRDGTFKVSYTPMTAGPTYTVQVFFENTEVPRSPFKVPVKPNIDMNKVHVDGLPSSKYQFFVATVSVDKVYCHKSDGRRQICASEELRVLVKGVAQLLRACVDGGMNN